jgi:hypothetical protein
MLADANTERFYVFAQDSRIDMLIHSRYGVSACPGVEADLGRAAAKNQFSALLDKVRTGHGLKTWKTGDSRDVSGGIR